MQHKIKKMSKRNVGGFHYNHFVQTSDKKSIIEIRQWCWDQFGPSADFREFERLDQ